MIATFPMAPSTMEYLFPDQPEIEVVLGRAKVEPTLLLAALECGELFSQARFRLVAGALQNGPFLERGMHVLHRLSLAVRGLTTDAAGKERIYEFVCEKTRQLNDSFESEDYAEAFHRAQDAAKRFEDLGGSILASFELLELGITRFCATEQLKLLGRLGIHLDCAHHPEPTDLAEAYRRDIPLEENTGNQLRRIFPGSWTTWLSHLAVRYKELALDYETPKDSEANLTQAIAQLDNDIKNEIRSFCKSDIQARNSVPENVPTPNHALAQRPVGSQDNDDMSPKARVHGWRSEFKELELYERDCRISAGKQVAQFTLNRFKLAYFYLKAFPIAVPDGKIVEAWRREGFGDHEKPKRQTIQNAIAEVNSALQQIGLELINHDGGRLLQRTGQRQSSPSRSRSRG